MDEAEVIELVLATIRAEADDVGYDDLRSATADTVIYGGDEGVDSLSLVRLIAAIEIAVERKLNRRVVLADEKAMSLRSSPFRSARTLAHLVLERLGSADG